MKDINDSDFTDAVLKADKPVLVDVWAAWCAPCRAIAPVLQRMSDNRPDIDIVKIDADSNHQVMNDYDVSHLPTLMLFHSGYMVGSWYGSARYDLLETWLNEQLAEIDL